MIGIYGGTFDPVHNGHLIIATEIFNITSLEKIIVIPTRTPPHKDGKVSANFEKRFEWTKTAFDGLEKIEISDFENSANPSYTIDTIRHFQNKYGKVSYIMGEDSFVNIEKWYKYEEILNLARLYVYPRYCDRSFTITLIKRFKNYDVHFLSEMPVIQISSTAIRERAQSGLSIRGYVPDKLEKDILEFYQQIGNQKKNSDQ
jgi:nicotinate-nucleotide adenylyltransferase